MNGAPQSLKSQLAEEYEAVLCEYLGGSGEAALKRAYEVGRRALTAGLGVLDMARLHHKALLRVLPPAPGRSVWIGIIRAAEKLFVETVTPFEMTHRGFGEVNAALRVSDKRYRELFENANDVVFTTDLEGNFTSINRAGERLTGYHRSEALSKNFETVIPPECCDVVRRAREAKLAGKDENTRYEIQVCTKDGRRIPMEVSTRLIYREGKPVGVQGIARDITERKMAEQAMRRVNEQLEEGMKRIAHALHDEAGQLLAAVYLTVEDIASRLPPEQREPLKRIHLPLDHAAGQLRRLSHELRPVILDDLGLLPALQFLTQGISQRTGLAITIDGWTQERLAPVVETALYRILQEALTNVSKHAQATRVTVRLQRDGETVGCTIRDDGVGFELSGAGAKRERAGLGLIGIRERLAVLGGTLSITTSPGRGTTLDMSIPLET